MMAQQLLWTVEIKLSIKSNGATVSRFVRIFKREIAPHEKEKGNIVCIPIGISNDKNTTTWSIKGEVVDVYIVCPESRFARSELVSKMEDTILQPGEVEDRLIAKGWRKV